MRVNLLEVATAVQHLKNAARRGAAWLGGPRLGVARHGVARHGEAWPGPARRGEAWHGLAWQGKVSSNERYKVKTFQIEIRGVTPLLIHRFGEESEQSQSTRLTEIKRRDPREEARKVAYVAEDGTFFFNAFAIPGAMGNAGSAHKAKGSRKSLRFVVPSAIRMTSDTIQILNGNGPAKDFEVDARPVTIPATKGRVMRYRPRFNEWGARFTLVLNDDLLSEEMTHQLLNEAGLSIGIGDFRPEKRGPFGTFRVTKFEEMGA